MDEDIKVILVIKPDRSFEMQIPDEDIPSSRITPAMRLILAGDFLQKMFDQKIEEGKQRVIQGVVKFLEKHSN